MLKESLQPFRSGRLSHRARNPLPAEALQGAGSARIPYAPSDDDLDRRRRAHEVVRFLVALYPQLR